jgi:hypothetical protein
MRLNLALLAQSENKTYENIFLTHECGISANKMDFQANERRARLTSGRVCNRVITGGCKPPHPFPLLKVNFPFDFRGNFLAKSPKYVPNPYQNFSGPNRDCRLEMFQNQCEIVSAWQFHHLSGQFQNLNW